jgi:hypothetical protein
MGFVLVRTLSTTLALCLTLAACNRGLEVLNFPLRWTGADGSPTASTEMSTAFAKQPFLLTTLVDKRQGQASVIGRHEETRETISTPTSVQQFCAERTHTLLASAGAKLVTKSDYVMTQELTGFEVVEGDTYSAKVSIRFTLSRGGTAVWTSVIDGTSKRWGKSRSEENYNEALSNALQSTIMILVSNKDFAKALNGQ